MAKVTMYRGVDPFDGVNQYIAVCGDRVALNMSYGNDKWLKPETFRDFSCWASHKKDENDIARIANAKLVWEADL